MNDPQPCSSRSNSFCLLNKENQRPDARLSVGVGWSPPTKWPRASTPRRRDSMGYSTFDSGYADDSFHSPPLQKTSAIPLFSGSPLLRTPKTVMQLPGCSLITPSPLRPIQYSQSSPSLSTKPLQLSNPRNSVGCGFREADLGVHGGMEMTSVNRRVNRCLQMPYPREDKCPNASDVMVSGLTTPQRAIRESSPDTTLPYRMAVETPSKELDTELDDSGLFTFSSLADSPAKRTSLRGFGSISAIHRIPEMTSGPLESSIFESFSDYMAHHPVMESPEPEPLPLSPPKRIALPPPPPQSKTKNILKIMKQKVGTPLLTSTPIVPTTMTSKPNESYSINKACGVLEATPIAQKGKRRRENDDGDVFVSPKKPLKPFSRRWMRIVCGTTRAQRELSNAAHDFLRRLKEGSVKEAVTTEPARDPLLCDTSKLSTALW